MPHTCDLCDNPYPYMCAECVQEDMGPAASRKTAATYSMGSLFYTSLKEKKDIPMAAPAKINISSGEDVELNF